MNRGSDAATVCPPSETLSALLDGDLPAPEADAARVHADGCTRCRTTLAELGALVSAARALESPEPPPTLWRALEGAAEPPPRWSWVAIRPFVTGALAGALAVGVVVLAIPAARERVAARATPAAAPVASAIPLPPDPLLDEAEAEFARAAATYERSIGKLRTLLERTEKGWSPEERARTSDRLARLDEVIARSRELARQSRGDSTGNEQLFAAYQQKIAFLAAAVHRGDEWREPSR